ncbi:MAG: hypothetical protein NTV35_16285 [Chloroflexi bacterium]|nr:hypothetical protein [Chloroflexota bacterium]
MSAVQSFVGRGDPLGVSSGLDLGVGLWVWPVTRQCGGRRQIARSVLLHDTGSWGG